MNDKRFVPLIALIAVLIGTTACASSPTNRHVEAKSYLVQAADLETARKAVLDAGGVITHELAVIRGVGADLTPIQVEKLRGMKGLRITDNAKIEVSLAGSDVGTDAPDFDLQTVCRTVADTGAEAKTQNLEETEHFFVNIEKRNFEIAGEGQLEIAANGPRMPRE